MSNFGNTHINQILLGDKTDNLSRDMMLHEYFFILWKSTFLFDKDTDSLITPFWEGKLLRSVAFEKGKTCLRTDNLLLIIFQSSCRNGNCHICCVRSHFYLLLTALSYISHPSSSRFSILKTKKQETRTVWKNWSPPGDIIDKYGGSEAWRKKRIDQTNGQYVNMTRISLF